MADYPPAFPSGDKAAHPTSTFEAGMTLRDWFAGQSITAAWECAMQFSPSGVLPEDFAAQEAYRIADAMLAERERVA